MQEIIDDNQNENEALINNTPNQHNFRKHKICYVSTKKIIGSYNTNGFYSAIIEGKRGIGKSSYALHVLHDVFLTLGYDDDTAWSMALDRCLFTIPEIVSFLKNAQSQGCREVCFCWDDAGVFGSNLRWFTHIKEVHMLQSLMDTIRSSVNGILITAPSQFSLLKFLRRYDNHIVQVVYDEPRGHWYRIAKGYQKYTLPSGKVLIFHRFNDYYYCRLPKRIYDAYMLKREGYNVVNIDSLEKMMVKSEERSKMHGIREQLQKIKLQKEVTRVKKEIEGGD